MHEIKRRHCCHDNGSWERSENHLSLDHQFTNGFNQHLATDDAAGRVSSADQPDDALQPLFSKVE